MRANAKRIAALLLTLVLLLGVLPTAAFASGETYKKVTSADELKSGGQFVLVAPNGSDYLALGTTIGAKIVPVPVADGELSGTDIPLWTMASSGDGVSFSNGKTYLAYGNSTSFKSGDPYTWNVTANSNGTFRFTASSASTRAIAYGTEQEQFGAYSTKNTSGYVFDLLVYKLTESEGGSEEITVAAPQAQPGASEVEAGTTVELTCATDGAAIYYTLDGSDPTVKTNKNRSAYADLDGNGIAINENCTLKAAAVLDGVWSEVQELKYTVKTGTPEEPTGAPLLNALDTGDIVAIYYPAGSKVMTGTKYTYTEKNKDELTAAGGTLTDGLLTAPEAAAFKVYKDADGHYTFQNDAGYLYLDGTHVRLVEEQGQYTLFDLEAATDGWYIKSTNAQYSGKPQYLEYYGGYFTCYGMNSSNAGIYTFQFYKLGTFTPEENQDPNPTPVNPTIADGDYVLYVPGYRKALSANYTGFYNMGVDMTLNADNVFDKVQASEVWTLANNTDGAFTLTSKSEGKKLGMGTDYSSMPLGSVNNSWTVEDAGNGLYYVKNVGRSAYIEWYADQSNFSSYYKIAPGSEGMFAIQFVPVTKSQIEEPSVVPGDIVDGRYFIHSAAARGVMRYASGGAAGSVPVTVEDGKVTFTDGQGTGAGVYTIKNISGGKYTIQLGSKYLGENNKEELTLNEQKDASCEWIIEAVEGGYTIKNASVKYYGSNTYLEYYASKGFCMYTMKAMSDIYVFNFYDASTVANTDGYVGTRPESGSLPTDGTYVIYNDYAKAVIGPQGGDDTSRNMSVVAAALVDSENGGKAVDAGNGGLIFTVNTYQEDGTTYYTFANNGKYLATDENDGDSNAETLFLQDNLTDYCKWTLEKTEGGYVMYNKEAAYKGSRVCVEYFSGAFSGWTYKGGTNEYFAFRFYPVTDAYGTGYVVNPKVAFTTEGAANLGLDFTVEFTLDDLGTDLSATALAAFDSETAEKTYAAALSGKNGTVTIPAADLAGHTALTITVQASSQQGTSETRATYQGSKTYRIEDLPVIVSVSPSPMSSVPTGTAPEIAVGYVNAGGNPTITMTVNGQPVTPKVEKGKISYQYNEMKDGKYTVTVSIVRADGKTAEKTWTFNVGKAQTNLYFGQLHSHTTYSDGSGTLQQALNYIGSLNSDENVDFVAFTDHSNYFDKSSAANPAEALYDTSKMTADSTKAWTDYKNAIAAFNAVHAGDQIALGGFEMTWSGGPGHINTFNTPGIVSRNNTKLNNKTNNAGMLDYYDLLVETQSQSERVTNSQFNHPGTTFGTFDSFTGWTAQRDEVMTLLEVGNGEGSVGSNGYFPSYGYYDMALSRGWHVAPTNNQDNHKGQWGNANTCRTVVLTDDFTEEGLYEAMAQRRVYATEDQNLSIVYTLNDVPMGGIIDNFTDSKVKISVSLSDANADDTIGKVQVIGENGAVLYTSGTITSNTAELDTELANTSAYYYIRVIEGDKDIAVTAPVWVDQVDATKFNVSASVTDKGEAVENQPHALTLSVTNKENAAITVNSYTITVDGVEAAVVTSSDSIASDGSKTYTYDWTPTAYGSHEVKAVFQITANGEAKTVSASKKIYVRGTNYNTVVSIADAKKGAKKQEFTLEGIVTSNASGYDKDTAFFDCIYIQDETGGINIFPVAGDFQVGQKVRVHGGITDYNGEIELNLSEDYGGKIDVIKSATTPVAPKQVSCADAMADGNIGLLMQVSGIIDSIHEVSGVVDRIYVDDGSGTKACVYINGYIKNSANGGDGFSGDAVKVGSKITAIGIGSVDADELSGGYLHRLRVRNRAEIQITKMGENGGSSSSGSSSSGSSSSGNSSKPSIKNPAVPSSGTLPFRDVSEGDWCYDAVKYAYENGLMAGTSASTFEPGVATTRGMIVTILYQLEGQPIVSGNFFPDVTSGQYYTDAVAWAVENGIVTGYDNGNFGPCDTITREQLAAILFRYASYKGYNVAERTDLSKFSDKDQIHGYAVEPLAWANSEGLVNGTSAVTLNPRGSATRAQVAVILTRFCQNIAQ